MPLPSPLKVLPRYLNPALRPLSRKLPPLALLHHEGRHSGRTYETPVQAYRTPHGYIAAYAYSDNPHWAQNLLATGHGHMTRAGKRYTITNPRHLDEKGLDQLPTPVRTLMKAISIRNALQLDAEPQH